MKVFFECLDKSQIINGLFASLIFATLIWIGRIVFFKTARLIKQYRIVLDTERITKILIYEYYLNTDGMYYFTQGYLLVILKAIECFITASIMFLFGHVITLLMPELRLLSIVAIYFSIQFLINGLSWLNPGTKDDLKQYDQDIVNKLKTNLVDKRRIDRSQSSDMLGKLTETKSALAEIQEMIQKLLKDNPNK